MVERVVKDFGVDLCAGVVTGTLRFLLRPIVFVFKWSRCLRVVFRGYQYAISQKGERGTASLSLDNLQNPHINLHCRT